MAFVRAKNGVTEYIEGQATVTAYFPVDERGGQYIACMYCRFYRSSSNRCGLNDQPASINANKYVGAFCPLVFDDGQPNEQIVEESGTDD